VNEIISECQKALDTLNPELFTIGLFIFYGCFLSVIPPEYSRECLVKFIEKVDPWISVGDAFPCCRNHSLPCRSRSHPHKSSAKA